MSERPTLQCDLLHPRIAVEDVRATAEFYRDRLGFEIGFIFDPPTIAGLNFDRVSVHAIQGTPNPEASSVYFVVSDVDPLFAWYCENGVEVVSEPTDQSYGLRDFSIRDNSGYLLRFGRHIHTGPKLVVERVPLETRIEKRLYSVIEEVAESKSMTLGEMLEETLLHSFERVPGGGVASPHTPHTLDLIQELKDKYALDYETHDSYRFTEEATEA